MFPSYFQLSPLQFFVYSSQQSVNNQYIYLQPPPKFYIKLQKLCFLFAKNGFKYSQTSI